MRAGNKLQHHYQFIKRMGDLLRLARMGRSPGDEKRRRAGRG